MHQTGAVPAADDRSSRTDVDAGPALHRAERIRRALLLCCLCMACPQPMGRPKPSQRATMLWEGRAISTLTQRSGTACQPSIYLLRPCMFSSSSTAVVAAAAAAAAAAPAAVARWRAWPVGHDCAGSGCKRRAPYRALCMRMRRGWPVLTGCDLLGVTVYKKRCGSRIAGERHLYRHLQRTESACTRQPAIGVGGLHAQVVCHAGKKEAQTSWDGAGLGAAYPMLGEALSRPCGPVALCGVPCLQKRPTDLDDAGPSILPMVPPLLFVHGPCPFDLGYAIDCCC